MKYKILLSICFYIVVINGYPIRERVGTDSVIGIDFGNSYTCVAVMRNGRIEVIPNEFGHQTTPSWVGFTDTEILVGESAKNQAYSNPGNTIFDIKRFIGRR